jgi:hypothetical protein
LTPSAEALERPIHQRPNLVVVSNVGGHGQCARADRFDFGGRLFQRLLTPPGDDDVGAAAGQVQCDGTSDTGSAAGHQGDRAAVDVGAQHLTGSAFRILDLHRTIASSRCPTDASVLQWPTPQLSSPCFRDHVLLSRYVWV